MTATPAPDRQTDRALAGWAGVEPGSHDHLGATLVPGGVDFNIYAKRASGVDLLLFDSVNDQAPARVVHLDPQFDRTGDYWHVHVPGTAHAQLYGFAVDGPWAPDEGLRFDASASCSTRMAAASPPQRTIAGSRRAIGAMAPPR